MDSFYRPAFPTIPSCLSPAVSGQGWENGNSCIPDLAKVLAGTIEPVLAAKEGRRPDWRPAV